MNKGMIAYIVAFVLLIGAALTIANSDPIAGAVVEARSETTVGVVTIDVLNQGLAFIAKLLFGATIAGVLSFVWVHGGKIYRRWWSEKLTRRWKPGPNAQFQQQGPKMPKLTREDVLLMAMANRERMPKMPKVRSTRNEESNEIDEINLDF